jgi:hypothetical protein
MEKIKAKTFAERIGFKDEDLTTPSHDQLLLWLINKENAVQLVNTVWNLKSYTTLRCFKCSSVWEYHRQGCDFNWEKQSCKDEDITKEYQEFRPSRQLPKEAIQIRAEVPLCQSYNNFTLGFLDAEIQFQGSKSEHFEFYYTPEFFIIEIKPIIYSLGELLRQLNFYKANLKTCGYPASTPIIVLTNTPVFSEQIISQGFAVYIPRVE